MMSNPILIIKCPWIAETDMAQVTSAIKQSVEGQLEGYQVLCFSKEDYTDFAFDCVSHKDEDPLDTEAIMRLITD